MVFYCRGFDAALTRGCGGFTARTRSSRHLPQNISCCTTRRAPPCTNKAQQSRTNQNTRPWYWYRYLGHWNGRVSRSFSCWRRRRILVGFQANRKFRYSLYRDAEVRLISLSFTPTFLISRPPNLARPPRKSEMNNSTNQRIAFRLLAQTCL
jgi:hypothetical protein